MPPKRHVDYDSFPSSHLAKTRRTLDPDVLAQMEATMESWLEDYKGSAASCLYLTMKHYMMPSSHFYARILPIVQSSGTGKSRMVDELSKTHIVIPVNLRDQQDSGYPPADREARDFLLGNLQSDIRYMAYLTALFETAEKEIATIRADLEIPEGAVPNQDQLVLLASRFRDLMIEGRQYEHQGQKRMDFHEKTVYRATKLMLVQRTFISNLQEAAGKLIKLVGSPESQMPLIIISFDEAHALLETMVSKDDRPLAFYYGRSLCFLQHLPIFTLVLSTSCMLSEFVSPSLMADWFHQSELISEPLPPYTELGFDQLAEKPVDGVKSIKEVSEDEYMVKFGRPLFATRYKYGDHVIKYEIQHFAYFKLARYNFNPEDASLACLSVRIPLQFTARAAADREQEERLVSDYMRICLHIGKRTEQMITIAPSEPILAQAARIYMCNAAYNLAHHLCSVLKGSAVDKGSHGELIALVILTLACDSAYKKRQSNAYGLLDFICNLFPPEKYEMICKAMPSISRTKSEEKNFETVFQTSQIYFNHFIRVNDCNVINRKHLCKLIARGAAVLCANNQRGVDIVIPFVFDNVILARKTTSAIIIQVKNDRMYNHKPQSYLFDAMDPFNIGFFDEDETNPVPVIRMVFALASPTPDVVVWKSEHSKPLTDEKENQYTAFDIWCAKIAHTFSVITSADEEYYEQLLKISRSGYEPDLDAKDRKILNPCEVVLSSLIND